MNPLPPSLSPNEITLLQTMKKSALAYLLMQRLGRATGAREIAAILGIHEQTAARYLRRLEGLSLVKRCRRKQGYVLLDSGKLAFVAINTLTNSIPPVHETAQFSQNPLNTALLSQNPVGACGFTAGDSHATILPRALTTEDTALLIQDPAGTRGIRAEDSIANTIPAARDTVQISQNLQDSAHFPQELVWAWGGFRADSNAGILARAPNTTNFSQYLQNTTKFSQYPVNNIITTTTTTDIKLINLKDSVEVVVLLIAPTTKISQYCKSRGHFGEKFAPHATASGAWAWARASLPGDPWHNNRPPNAPEGRYLHPLRSVPTGFGTVDPGDFFSQEAPRSRWIRQPPLKRNTTGHLTGYKCPDYSSYWVSRAGEDP